MRKQKYTEVSQRRGCFRPRKEATAPAQCSVIIKEVGGNHRGLRHCDRSQRLFVFPQKSLIRAHKSAPKAASPGGAGGRAGSNRSRFEYFPSSEAGGGLLCWCLQKNAPITAADDSLSSGLGFLIEKQGGDNRGLPVRKTASPHNAGDDTDPQSLCVASGRRNPSPLQIPAPQPQIELPIGCSWPLVGEGEGCSPTRWYRVLVSSLTGI